eukprot:CAMPEP_0201475700 /NCGR_PEP_ID=MMETSP0151_2-20130828/1068_1 /ASSEMBLY_ACC=CAM_ASM_000257 /TAXON_ID=200890 /ORGANISM="Paramoeba atlantica, Strain 621/1 / CCAP 1560/9" /LENGTH=485 /DNA_ID=CAMNT_0047855861 /DNA_START=31 /DNA_END=1488 /DNA_ORIENTATION=-
MASSSLNGYLVEKCYTFDPETNKYSRVNVAIVGKEIAKISESDLSSEFEGLTKINGEGKLLLPGFVNGHTHSNEFWSRGVIDETPLELWLASLIDRSSELVTKPEHLYYSALHCGLETITSGGTAIIDHPSLIIGSELECLEAISKAYRTLGIRAFVAPLVFDLEFTNCVSPCSGEARDYQAQDTEGVLKWMEIAIQKFHRPEEGFNMMIGPTGIQLCSDALYRGLVELSKKYNLARHTHCLETKNQVDLAASKYGCTVVEHLADLGFLDSKTTLAHSIHLSDGDIEVVRKHGSTVVHNPLSNLRLGSGLAPLIKYRDQGLSIAMGCDGAASNDSQDLLEAVKIGTILHTVSTPEYRKWITPAQSVKFASVGGATGLGQQDTFGRLAPKFRGDLVLYDLENLSLLPKGDPVRMLILGRHVNVISHVWVDGKLIVSDHKPTTVDVEEMRKKISEKQTYDFEKPVTENSLRTITEENYRKARGLDQQ